MNKLSLFAVSVSGALVCTAVPASFNWSPAKLTLFSLDTAEAQVLGVSRRVERRAYRRAAVGVAVLELSVLGLISRHPTGLGAWGWSSPQASAPRS